MLMYCCTLNIVLISQACQRTIFRSWQKNRVRFAAFLRMNRDGIRRECEKERERERERESSMGNANEKREEAEDRTYNSAVITCTVSYSPRGDTRSIPIQRISCRGRVGTRIACRFGTRKSGCTGNISMCPPVA